MLKTGDYDLWSVRMEQYLTHTDYTLWEVIINSDSPVLDPPAIGKSSSSSNSHNVAFVSSENISSINKAVNAAHDIFAACSKEQPSASSYTDDAVMITMRLKRFIKKTRRNLNFNGKDPVGFDKTRVGCYNYHKRGHFSRECHAPRNQGNRSGNNERRVVPVETPASALVGKDGVGHYDWSYQAKEGPTDFALMTHSLDSANSSNSKTGLGYDNQLSKNEMPKCENFETTSDSSVSEIDEDNNQAKDRYKVGIGYHAVPPPYTRNYMPPRADISFAGLDDSMFMFKISETRTREEPKNVRLSFPIIEDWESDSEDVCVDKSSTKQDEPSNDNSVKSNECTGKNISRKHINNHDENLRKRQDSRVDWNGMW
nr:ribonuclease H-like domain-containing protein [Tanacetum cinerariifolium]